MHGAAGRANLNSHMQQVAYGSCMAMARAYQWLFRQPSWLRAYGADHIVLTTFKDRLARYGRTAERGMNIRNASCACHTGDAIERGLYHACPIDGLPDLLLCYAHAHSHVLVICALRVDAVLANAIFATTEDRLLHPERRLGQTSVVVPYYADPLKWAAEDRSFDELVALKSRLITFIGNRKGYECHLEHETCTAYRYGASKGAGPHNANRLRSVIIKAIRQHTNGSGTIELHRQPPSVLFGRDNVTLLASTFCPTPLVCALLCCWRSRTIHLLNPPNRALDGTSLILGGEQGIGRGLGDRAVIGLGG